MVLKFLYVMTVKKIQIVLWPQFSEKKLEGMLKFTFISRANLVVKYILISFLIAFNENNRIRAKRFSSVMIKYYSHTDFFIQNSIKYV